VWPAELYQPQVFSQRGRINWDHDPELLEGDFVTLKERPPWNRSRRGVPTVPGPARPHRGVPALAVTGGRQRASTTASSPAWTPRSATTTSPTSCSAWSKDGDTRASTSTCSATHSSDARDRQGFRDALFAASPSIRGAVRSGRDSYDHAAVTQVL
jgi:hypothetical protein